ncbi:MAG: nucleotidyltransferase domain-containing protein [Armatimonadota bacterium]|nr:nucleotidyltransferase domain-containing protein [Armatimonadota bacterium]
MSQVTSELDELVRQIVDLVHPLRIVLFGSAARGEAGRYSDLNVMVVMPDGTHRRHTAQNLYRNLPGIEKPVDFVVATPSDLEKHKDTIGLVYRDIIRDGRELYAA